MAWGTFRSFSVLLRGVEPVKPVAASSGKTGLASGPESLLRGLPPEGPWTFGDNAWAIAAVEVSAAELDRRLLAFDQSVAAADVDSNLAERPALPLGDRLGAAVRSSEVAPGRRVYRHETPRARLRIATGTAQGVERFLGGALAMVVDPAGLRWKLWEMLPNSQERSQPRAPAKIGSPLMPLPESARRLAGRWAIDGRLWLEIVDIPDSAAMPRFWAERGWTVLPLDDLHHYVCRRGEEVVLAWTPTPLVQLRPGAAALWFLTRASSDH